MKEIWKQNKCLTLRHEKKLKLHYTIFFTNLKNGRYQLIKRKFKMKEIMGKIHLFLIIYFQIFK